MEPIGLRRRVLRFVYSTDLPTSHRSMLPICCTLKLLAAAGLSGTGFSRIIQLLSQANCQRQTSATISCCTPQWQKTALSQGGEAAAGSLALRLAGLSRFTHMCRACFEEPIWQSCLLYGFAHQLALIPSIHPFLASRQRRAVASLQFRNERNVSRSSACSIRIC